MVLCGVFWRSNRNHYLLVIVMRALVMSIHVHSYLPKFDNEMHYYCDIIPTAVPWAFFFTGNIFCFGTKYDANLEIMSCQVVCCQPLHTHVHQDPNNNWRVPFKIRFARFSLVSLSIHPRSRRGAERIRQGEGRWSRPPKTALERSDFTDKNSSSEHAILRPRQKKLMTECQKKE